MSQSCDPRLRRAVDVHTPVVSRRLRQLGVPACAIDDAAQQVLVVFSRRLADVRDGAERAFMLATATRIASDLRKQQRRSPEDADSETLDAHPSTAPSADELIDQARDRVLLARAIAELPEELRTVLVLSELEERTMASIAEQCAIPAGTVASRLRRARAALDRAVGGGDSRRYRAVPLLAALTGATGPRAAKAALVAKWFAIVGLAASVAFVVLRGHGARTVTPAPLATASLVRVTPTLVSAPTETAQEVTAQEVTTPAPVASSAKARPSRPRLLAPASTAAPPAPPAEPTAAPAEPTAGPAESTIASQVRALRAVRAALAGHDASLAAARLDAFDLTYPRSPLEEEALVLHIDVLDAAGARSAARARALSFLAAHPSSAYAAHVRAQSTAP